MIYKYI